SPGLGVRSRRLHALPRMRRAGTMAPGSLSCQPPASPAAHTSPRPSMRTLPRVLTAVAVFFIPAPAGAAANEFSLTGRSRAEQDAKSEPVNKPQTWPGKKTAVIVCDMWDAHHCLNAVRREEELVPRVNEFLNKARDTGALIIHAPSSCMDAYKDHPA